MHTPSTADALFDKLKHGTSEAVVPENLTNEELHLLVHQANAFFAEDGTGESAAAFLGSVLAFLFEMEGSEFTIELDALIEEMAAYHHFLRLEHQRRCQLN